MYARGAWNPSKVIARIPWGLWRHHTAVPSSKAHCCEHAISALCSSPRTAIYLRVILPLLDAIPIPIIWDRCLCSSAGCAESDLSSSFALFSYTVPALSPDKYEMKAQCFRKIRASRWEIQPVAERRNGPQIVQIVWSITSCLPQLLSAEYPIFTPACGGTWSWRVKALRCESYVHLQNTLTTTYVGHKPKPHCTKDQCIFRFVVAFCDFCICTFFVVRSIYACQDPTV